MISLNKFIRKREKKIGLPPGTPVFVGEKKTEEVKITILDFDETQFEEREIEEVEECFPFKETPSVTWINVNGIHNVENIEKLGKNFEMHPLILEDIVNAQQRPKMEDFEKYIYRIENALL